MSKNTIRPTTTSAVSYVDTINLCLELVPPPHNLTRAKLVFDPSVSAVLPPTCDIKISLAGLYYVCEEMFIRLSVADFGTVMATTTFPHFVTNIILKSCARIINACDSRHAT